MSPETVSFALVLVGLLLGLQIANLLLTFVRTAKRQRREIITPEGLTLLMKILPDMMTVLKPPREPFVAGGPPLSPDLDFSMDNHGNVLCNRPDCKVCNRLRADLQEEEAKREPPPVS